MQDLKIAFIQTRLYWEDNKANQLHFSRLIANLKSQPDLIVLPETFNTGFRLIHENGPKSLMAAPLGGFSTKPTKQVPLSVPAC